MIELAGRKCVPCRGGTPPLTVKEILPLSAQLDDWTVAERHHIKKTFHFKDFQSALDFVNQVGAIAEAEDHHPDICLAWGKVQITSWTHKIGGLSESDFILAAKIDRAFGEAN